MQIKRLTRAQYRKTSSNGRGHFIYREWERELIICLFCLAHWFQWVMETNKAFMIREHCIDSKCIAARRVVLTSEVRWGQRLSQTRPTPGSRTIIHSFLGSIQQNEGQHPASNNQSSFDRICLFGYLVNKIDVFLPFRREGWKWGFSIYLN